MFTIVKLELCEPQLSYRKRRPHIVYMDHPKRPRREQIAQLTAVNLSIHLKLQPQSTASKERQDILVIETRNGRWVFEITIILLGPCEFWWKEG